MKRVLLFAILLIMGLAVLPLMLRYLWAVLSAPERAWSMAKAFDRFANAGANGLDTETISSRAGKAVRQRRPWACVLCRLLDLLERDHCRNSIGT